MIQSLLDNDLYKFSTSYAYMKLFPNAWGKFEFIDRDNKNYNDNFVKKLNLELYKLSDVSLTKQEFKYVCNNIKYIPRFYWEWLRGFKFNVKEVTVELVNNKLKVTVEGPLYRVTLWEVVILAIISELTYKLDNKIPESNYIRKIEEKVKYSERNNIYFSELGTRRRFSYKVHENVSKILSKSKNCTGTSNVHFAMIHNQTPIGTHPHEYFMFHGAIYSYKNANYLALENWIKVYDGNLGIALTDTFGTEMFISNFSTKHAKLFDGVRHDSGDPYKFTNNIINRYKQLNVDPASKTIVFSDGLDLIKCSDIKTYCDNRIMSKFGIGTYLTNDVGANPCKIVMKLTECRISDSQPVRKTIKISDNHEKAMGCPDEISFCLTQI